MKICAICRCEYPDIRTAEVHSKTICRDCALASIDIILGKSTEHGRAHAKKTLAKATLAKTTI